MKAFIETVKSYWGYFIVGLITLILLIHFTFFWYPILINKLFLFHVPDHDFTKEDFGRGTFGDMYGAYNSFVASIASIGAVIAILVQIYIHNSEKNREKTKEKEIQSKKIKYFGFVLHELKSQNLPALQNLYKSILEQKNSGYGIEFIFHNFEIHDLYFEFVRKLDFEEYFILIDSEIPEINRTIFKFSSQIRVCEEASLNFNVKKKNYVTEIRSLHYEFIRLCDDYVDKILDEIPDYKALVYNNFFETKQSFFEMIGDDNFPKAGISTDNLRALRINIFDKFDEITDMHDNFIKDIRENSETIEKCIFNIDKIVKRIESHLLIKY